MKALFCGYCMTIASLGPGSEEVVCRCRATNGREKHGARCRGRWVSPERGTAIFTEIAHGGNEREFPDRNGGRCFERGTAIGEPKALFVLGIHNTLLTHQGHSLDHVAVARGSGRSLFAVQESLIVRFRPGESIDTAYVSLADFEAGRFPDDPLPSLPEDQRVYRDEPAWFLPVPSSQEGGERDAG